MIGRDRLVIWPRFKVLSRRTTSPHFVFFLLHSIVTAEMCILMTTCFLDVSCILCFLNICHVYLIDTMIDSIVTSISHIEVRRLSTSDTGMREQIPTDIPCPDRMN